MIIGTRIADQLNKAVRLTKSDIGCHAVAISQSKLPIMRGSVMWKIELVIEIRPVERL